MTFRLNMNSGHESPYSVELSWGIRAIFEGDRTLESFKLGEYMYKTKIRSIWLAAPTSRVECPTLSPISRLLTLIVATACSGGRARVSQRHLVKKARPHTVAMAITNSPDRG